MPSEGKPLPIDTARITRPSDAPTANIWLLADRRERHIERLAAEASGGIEDAVAALALSTAARRNLEEQEPRLVSAALRHGGTWPQIAEAVGAEDPQTVRAAFLDWADRLPADERAEAQLLAEASDR